MPTDLTDDTSSVLVITWTNVDPDLCHHLVSLVLNELNEAILKKIFSSQ